MGHFGEDTKVMCVAYDHHQGYEVYGYIELYQLSIPWCRVKCEAKAYKTLAGVGIICKSSFKGPLFSICLDLLPLHNVMLIACFLL